MAQCKAVGHYETDTYIIRDSNYNSFLVPVHGLPEPDIASPEIIVHNASASDLDEDILSELEEYQDADTDKLLEQAMREAKYDLAVEYYATDEKSDKELDFAGMDFDNSGTESCTDYHYETRREETEQEWEEHCR